MSVKCKNVDRLIRWQKSVAVLIIFTVAICHLSACSDPGSQFLGGTNPLRLEPTGKPVTFDAASYSDFGDYINKTRAHLADFKVYLNPDNSEIELDAATPFRVHPDHVENTSNCAEQVARERGIVLVHGLSDMPVAMKDIALALAKKCFVTYSILLPGHGARPAELMSVKASDWIGAVSFGVEAMRQEVDEVYVGGFSLGGLLALQSATADKDIAGVLAISPALSLHRSFFLDQTSWIRYVKKWLDTDPPDDPWRFESIPFNALAETQRLSKSVRQLLEAKPLEVPVLLIQSPDDAVVNAEINRQYFFDTMKNPTSRLVSYTNLALDAMTTEPQDSRQIVRYPNQLPDMRILSYAHQAIHTSPSNPHYGVNGVYRNCLHDLNTNAKAIENCKTSENVFRGEVFGSAVARYKGTDVDSIARLTYNPQFSEMLDEIDIFLQGVSTNRRSTKNE